MNGRHALLREPLKLDERRVMEVYDFSMGLKGSPKKAGVSKAAQPYEPMLRQTAKEQVGTSLDDWAEVVSYTERVRIQFEKALLANIPRKKYEPHAHKSVAMTVQDSCERIVRTMGMTCKTIVTLSDLEAELERVRSMRATGQEFEATLRKDEIDLPTMQAIASADSLGRAPVYKFSKLFRVMHALGLDVGDRVRTHYELNGD